MTRAALHPVLADARLSEIAAHIGRPPKTAAEMKENYAALDPAMSNSVSANTRAA
jgi:hypothetical protein